MRQIGQLRGEPAARLFGDYLFVLGIDNDVEQEADGSWSIWIHAEEELDRATKLLEEFRADSTNPKFQTAARGAKALREGREKEQADYEKRVSQRRHLFKSLRGYNFGALTFVLICVSVYVAVISQLGDNPNAIRGWFISDSDVAGIRRLPLLQKVQARLHVEGGVLPEVQHGEVWRLLTPIFIHFGIWHILFNMLWLKDLGSMIEGRQNSLVLAALVLVSAIVSNVLQYFVGGPIFGGMSGVIYALLGYVWIRGKFDPASGLFLHPTNVTMMIVWFFLCFTGHVGDIANAAHAGGLIVGVIWGYLSSLRYR